MNGDLIYSLGEQGPMTAGQTYSNVCEEIAFKAAVFGHAIDPDGDLAHRLLAAHSGIFASARAASARYQAERAASR